MKSNEQNGKWINFIDEVGEHNDIKMCSSCKKQAYWDTDYGQQLFDFCPYCGTDMREIKKH